MLCAQVVFALSGVVCSRSPLCVSYEAGFETEVGIRHFEGLSILAKSVQDSLRAYCHRTVPKRCRLAAE